MPLSVSEQIDLAREADFMLGALAVHPSTREIERAGAREILEPRVMQVLVALAKRRGEVVSRDDLFRQCWENRIVGDDAMNRCISRLRRVGKAGDDFAIEAIPRVGYRLSETAADDAPPDVARRHAKPRLTVRGIAALGVAVVLAGGLLLWRLTLYGGSDERVAVLPFDALSAASETRFFGDAVAEQIVAVLNENQVLAVSRDRSAALRGAGRDAAVRKLGVEFVLDGAVQKGETGLRVTVHLDHATTHATLWTASFDQGDDDAIALQTQIAAKAVDEVKSALQARRGGAPNDATLAAYLKALEYGRIGGQNATAMRRDLLRTVVAQAPRFSLGYSGLAVTSAQLLQYSDPPEATKLRMEARTTAARALALDPQNGEAYLALAMLVPPADAVAQEALYRKGLAAAPDEPTLNSNLSALMADVGRQAAALALQQRAVMLDPLSPRKTAALAQNLALAGNITEARAIIDRAARLWPSNPGVWFVRLYILCHSDPAAARATMASQRRPAGIEENFLVATRAYLDALAERTPVARARAAAAVQAALAARDLDETAAIEMLAQIGEIDAAFALTDTGMTQKSANGAAESAPRPHTAVFFRPATRAMRDDARFAALARRSGILAYWEKRTDLPDFCSAEAAPICRALNARHRRTGRAH
jgi:DNA-binding winged helix-turn-helix (wHTH) protein/TolB-like protein